MKWLNDPLRTVAVVFVLPLSIILLLPACQIADAELPEARLSDAVEARGEPLKAEAESVTITNLTLNSSGELINPVTADPSTLLFYARTGEPILGPDGEQITAGVYSATRGTLEAKCLNKGTHIQLHLEGLIPHATYRAWLITFKSPGFDLSLPNPFVNALGTGALGPSDRSRNTFVASASGQGTLVRFMPAGPYSELGEVDDCLLDEFEWHLVLAFQQPGQPGGTEVGSPAFFPYSAVEQLVFILRQD